MYAQKFAFATISSLLMLCAPFSAVSQSPEGESFYCQERGLGDYFYCQAPETVEPDPIPRAPTPATPAINQDLEDLETFKKELDEKMKIAVWNPTDENMYDYMEMQVVMLNKSEAFANNFEKTVWQNPELNYQVEHPTNKLALQHYRAETRNSHQRHMKTVKDRYGFYYFYAGGCGACQIFSPLLSGFADVHDLTIMAISMDGAPNDDFEDWFPDNGISKRVGFDQAVTPALLLFDTQTGDTVPISFGVVTIDELEKRIFKLTGGTRRPYINNREG